MKIINETLKDRSGWSTKRLTWLVFMILFCYITIKGFSVGIWPPDVVFYVLITGILGQSALTMIQKLNSKEPDVYTRTDININEDG